MDSTDLVNAFCVVAVLVAVATLMVALVVWRRVCRLYDEAVARQDTVTPPA